MAAAKKSLFPPSEESPEPLLAVVASSSEPATAAVLVKQLEAENKMSAAAASTLLEEAVTAGTLYRYPPKTAKGKPRYWNRDFDEVVRSAVQAAVARVVEPVTAKEFLKLLDIPFKVRESEILPHLEAAVAAGNLFQIPPATAKGGPRYWTGDLPSLGRRDLTLLIKAKGPQPETQLKKALKGFPESVFRDLFNELIEEKVLRPHPPAGRVKKVLYGLHPPSPEPYLKEIGSLLQKAVTNLREAEVSEADLRRSVVELLDFAGIPLAEHQPERPPRGAANEPPSAARADVDLLALIRKTEPRADRGALVGVGQLRAAAGLSKADFDAIILELAKLGRLTLHRHDYPASLSDAAREELVCDGAGNYYVGVALRPAM